MAKISTSVIISTYDAPKSLNLCLSGYKRQSVKDFELVVADDGSGQETKDIVDNIRRVSDFEVRHIWQENKGCYGKPAILNKAVLSTSSDLLIFSEGDCIPQKDFVKEHIENFQKNSFRFGGRVDLDKRCCEGLNASIIESGEFEVYLTLLKKLDFSWAHAKNLFYIAIEKRRRPQVYGSNMSIDRETFFNINGYDENFVGLSGVDDDIRNRLKLYGAKPICLWHKAFIFHIDHSFDKSRLSHTPRNREKGLEYRRRELKLPRCENGLVKEGVYVRTE